MSIWNKNVTKKDLEQLEERILSAIAVSAADHSTLIWLLAGSEKITRRLEALSEALAVLDAKTPPTHNAFR